MNRAIVFCSACGCFSERKPKLLAKQCKGKTAPGTKMQRELLEKGVFPQAGSSLRLGKPAQFS